MAVYRYRRKKRPYTVRIIRKDSTVMNSPPMRVTAHRGMDSKKPQSSTAVTIYSGSTMSPAAPRPEALRMVDTKP